MISCQTYIFARDGPEKYQCQHPTCNKNEKPRLFKRAADRHRHYENVHATVRNVFPCDYSRCPRNQKPLKRKDHYRHHLRDYHKEDVGLSIDENKGKCQELQIQAGQYNIKSKFWRCAKCLVRNYFKDCGWECSTCKTTCEKERIQARIHKMLSPLDSEEINVSHPTTAPIPNFDVGFEFGTSPLSETQPLPYPVVELSTSSTAPKIAVDGCNDISTVENGEISTLEVSTVGCLEIQSPTLSALLPGFLGPISDPNDITADPTKIYYTPSSPKSKEPAPLAILPLGSEAETEAPFPEAEAPEDFKEPSSKPISKAERIVDHLSTEKWMIQEKLERLAFRESRPLQGSAISQLSPLDTLKPKVPEIFRWPVGEGSGSNEENIPGSPGQRTVSSFNGNIKGSEAKGGMPFTMLKDVNTSRIVGGLFTILFGELENTREKDFELPFDPYPFSVPESGMRYTKMYTNKYPKRLRLSVEVVEERCTCMRSGSSTCGEHCANVIMGYECDEKICPLGPTCGNRASSYLRLGVAVRLKVIKITDNEFGLRSAQHIVKDQLLLEYTGCVIEEKEYNRRVEKKEVCACK
jgi:hypothetical protein